MKNKDIIELLQTVDEETAVQLCEDYHGISENTHRRLRKKIHRKLSGQDFSGYEDFPETVIVKKSRFSWIPKAATAAAYFLVFGVLIAGLFNMNIVEPDERQQELTNIPLIEAEENFYAHNMVSSGALIVNVKKAEFTAESVYQVTLEIKSENAVSYNGTQTFFADNFRMAYITEKEIIKTISPCRISKTGDSYVYAFTLANGESCEMTLTYQLNETPDALISGYSEESAYIKLTEA